MNHRRLQNLAIGLSLATAVLMLAGKTLAYQLTGSAAILSDAIESVIHLFATALVALSLRYSRKPADQDHPYGHGRIAYFSSGFEGGLIVIASAGIIWKAVEEWIQGPELNSMGIGFSITLGLAAVNLALGQFLVRIGNRSHSLILVSNGRHVLTDMWTSLGIAAGVLFVYYTNIVWLDPLFAIAVALNILWTAFGLIRNSYSGLMDRTDNESTDLLIRTLRESAGEGLIADYHQLRHRQTNDEIWIEAHLLFPNDLKLDEAHARATDVENRVRALFLGKIVRITTHLEPSDHGRAHPEGHPGMVDPLKTREKQVKRG